MSSLWSLLMTLMVVVVPLLLAWWLVARGVQRAEHSPRGQSHNGYDRRSPL